MVNRIRSGLSAQLVLSLAFIMIHCLPTHGEGFRYSECKDSEKDSNCLDEATCLATEGAKFLEGIKNCRCTEGWMGARCQDRTTTTSAATTTSTPKGHWSLSCPQTLYVGALNRSVTFQCRVTGVNLYENEIFGRVIWTTGSDDYGYKVLEVLMRLHKPLLTKSGSYYKGRVSLKPAPFFSSSNTDISLTISNIQPKDFGDYQVEVLYATEGNFRQPKKLSPITLKEQLEIDICDFNGVEIDFPQSSEEVQSILLTYPWHSSSDCEAFLGMTHDMHFKLEVVSFHPFHPVLYCDGDAQAHPMLQMLQMQDVINLTNSNEIGHTLRVFDLCAVFVALHGRRMPLPHSFHINGETDFKNILGLKLAGRYGAPGFELRLTRIPAPVKAPITVPIESPARLQCWGACPFDNANLLWYNDYDTRQDVFYQDVSYLLRKERVSAGKKYSVFQGIKIEGEAKGFRRRCPGGHAATVAMYHKIDVKGADLEAGTYIIKYDDHNNCTFFLKAGGK